MSEQNARTSNRTDVLLYTSGLVQLTREVEVPQGGKTFTSRVKRKHLGAIIQSLQVGGAVIWEEAAEFAPDLSGQSSERERNYSSRTDDWLRGMIDRYQGSRAEILRKSTELFEEVTLCGTEVLGEEPGMASVIVFDGSGVSPIPFSDMATIKFAAEVNEEIQRNLERVALATTEYLPFSLTLKPYGEEAVVGAIRTVVPNAAPVFRYTLSRCVDGGWALCMGVTVHNETTEDWDGALTVFSGKPQSFDTDLAEPTVPNRQKVRLAPVKTGGPVEADEEVRASLALYDMGSPVLNLQSVRSQKAARAAYSAMEFSASEEPTPAQYGAGVKIDKAGELFRFESATDICVKAGKSGLVPLAELPLEDAVAESLVKDEATVAYSTLRFTAPDHPLPKGSVTVYGTGNFDGDAIINEAPPCSSVFLAFQEDPGVKPTWGCQKSDITLVGVTTTSGRLLTRRRQVYTKALKLVISEDKRVSIERHRRLGDESELRLEGVAAEVQETKEGFRFTLQLAKGVYDLTLVETAMAGTEVFMVNNGATWVLNNLMAFREQIGTEEFEPVLAIASQIQKKTNLLTEEKQLMATKKEGFEDLRKLVGSLKNDKNEGEVAEAEDLRARFREMETLRTVSIPNLEKEIRGLNDELNAALEAVTVSWTQ